VNQHDEQVLGQLHSDLAAKVRQILAHVNHPEKLPPGVELHAHMGYRSPADQLAAFRAGNSKLKRGAHNYRPAMACDLVFQVRGQWSWAGSLPWWLVGYWAEVCGLRWGGRWGTPGAQRKAAAHDGMRLGWDCPHVELPDWVKRARS
jgi:hypothetical protein